MSEPITNGEAAASEAAGTPRRRRDDKSLPMPAPLPAVKKNGRNGKGGNGKAAGGKGEATP